jgi:hypothetical protein
LRIKKKNIFLIHRNQPELLLSKVNAVDGIFCSWTLFVQHELQMISDMSIRIYSSASIAENPMLAAVISMISVSLIEEIQAKVLGLKNDKAGSKHRKRHIFYGLRKFKL